MKIRIEQYSGTAVSNNSSVQFVTLVDPPISDFKTYLNEGTASYEATVGVEELTYETFTFDYSDSGLFWSGMKFHKLTDGDWVARLREDKFINDNFYFTNIDDSTKLKIATFGTANANKQLDMTDVDDFNHSYLNAYKESFCSLNDVELILRSGLPGRISIGELNESASNTNLLSYEEIYTLIKNSWAKITINLSKRYDLPISINNEAVARLLADISAKDVGYTIYSLFYPVSKFGEAPEIIFTWKKEVNKFFENIGKLPLDGIVNKLGGAGGVYEFERG